MPFCSSLTEIPFCGISFKLINSKPETEEMRTSLLFNSLASIMILSNTGFGNIEKVFSTALFSSLHGTLTVIVFEFLKHPVAIFVTRHL